jgi:hypothetical protein
LSGFHRAGSDREGMSLTRDVGQGDPSRAGLAWDEKQSEVPTPYLDSPFHVLRKHLGFQTAVSSTQNSQWSQIK